MRLTLHCMCLVTLIALGCDSQPIAVTNHKKDFERQSKISRAIDYSEYAAYATCTFTAPLNDELVEVEVQSESLLTRLKTLGPGFAGEPLNLLDTYVRFQFEGIDQRDAPNICIYFTRDDDVLMLANGEWFELECEKEEVKAMIQSVIDETQRTAKE